jgi:hypothetical protein
VDTETWTDVLVLRDSKVLVVSPLDGGGGGGGGGDSAGEEEGGGAAAELGGGGAGLSNADVVVRVSVLV